MSKEAVPYAQIGKGTLLIASPDVNEGLFFRSVVLVCEHSPSGSFGLILNKSLDMELPEDVVNLKEIDNPNVQLRAGGPTQPNQMMLLHSSSHLPDETLNLCEGVYLGGDLQFLQEAIHDQHGPSIRLCFGYSGWDAGGLEREFLNGSWFLQPANSRYVFEIPPDKLWQTILREMGGKYATLSMIPEDPSLN